MEVDGQACILDIMDTAGQVSFSPHLATSSDPRSLRVGVICCVCVSQTWGRIQEEFSAYVFPLSLSTTQLFGQWLTSPPRARRLRDQYMKTGQGFLLAYSVTSTESFEAAAALRSHIMRIKEDEPDVNHSTASSLQDG